MMMPCARPASLMRASAPLSTRNWSTCRETSARVNCPSGSFGGSGKRNGRGFLASNRDFQSFSGRRIDAGFMSSATSMCFPTNTIAPRTLLFTEFKYASSSGCVGWFGGVGFATTSIGGAAHFGSGGGGAPPNRLNPPPGGSVNPGGSSITTCAVTTPFVLGVHARGFTMSCPWNGVTASARRSMFSQPGTGVAALGGWNVHGSRCVFASPHDVIVLTAQSSAAFKFDMPVTRGPYTSAISWIIHMILELFVSSARICAYVSETPGACAGRGTADSIKQHSTHPISFATVPPRIFSEVLNLHAPVARQYTLQRPPRQCSLRKKRGKPVDELMQRFETLAYDPWRKTGMASADDVAGVHSSIGGVFERDHGDAHCDSRARSDNAESRGEKRFRSEPDAAIARAGIASGRP